MMTRPHQQTEKFEHLTTPHIDEQFMAIALRLAGRGLGATWPNPSVGAVITHGNEVVARGWTQPGGRPHGETDALLRAGEGAKGATMYVTFEPCAHHGQTPPCADAIVAADVSRVVCPITDPDPRVAGGGIARLKDAGVTIETGVHAAEARWITAGHILRKAERRPFVQLKLAVSADSRVASGDGAPVWVTGPVARAHGHLMRATADAILIGRGTLQADDPKLTCRLPGLEHRSPVRILLDSKLGLSPASKLAQSASHAGLWVFTLAPPNQNSTDALTNMGVKIHRFGGGQPGLISPAAALERLADEGITRLLIEGGPRVARSFLDAGVVDEVLIYRGTRELGANGLLPLVDRDLKELEADTTWQLSEARALGDDNLVRYRNRASLATLERVAPEPRV